jgi:hypothetical protein
MRRARRRASRAGADFDPVEACSMDSFPASDPPSWTPIVSIGPRARDDPR